MVEVNGIIQMVPVIPILEMRGYFKGHEIEYAREKKAYEYSCMKYLN
jgi:hypothetical protein